MTAVPNYPAAPVGQQGPPARAAASAVRALCVARGSLIDYRDGLPPCLTNSREADITMSPNGAFSTAPSWSRSIGIAGRHPSERVVAIIGMRKNAPPAALGNRIP